MNDNDKVVGLDSRRPAPPVEGSPARVLADAQKRQFDQVIVVGIDTQQGVHLLSTEMSPQDTVWNLMAMIDNIRSDR